MRFHGFDPAEALVEVEPDGEDGTFSTAAIERAIAEHGRAWRRSWPGVQYRTGQAFDLAEIARLGRAAGATVGLRPRARGRQPVRSRCTTAARISRSGATAEIT